MSTCADRSRRDFIKASLWGGAALAAWPWGRAGAALVEPTPAAAASRVALTAGNDHADLIFKSLQPFQKEIARAIGERMVIIKPNNVGTQVALCATPAQSLEGILEFLKSICKDKNVIIAESAASGPTFEGFSNYGYERLAGKYGAKLVDLDAQPIEVVQVFDEKDFRPHPMRTSKLLLDRNNFIISAAKFKTHDRVVATLSLKNIVVGAPVKDLGFRWGPASKAGARNDKPIMHGNGFRGINYNLFALASKLRPDLAVIDGYEGMEGEGPISGTAVDHRVAVSSLDWVAADRVALELMGIDYAKVGYLNYCAGAGLGQGDLSKIEILGPALKEHIKPYKLAKNIEQQLIWMQPVKS